MMRLTKTELSIGALLYPERGYWRPRTRAQCSNVERPCPYVGCRYHLYSDMMPSGDLRINYPHLEPWQLQRSCTLDLVEEFEFGMTLEEVGRVIGLTRERVRQIITKALDNVARRAPELAASLREIEHKEHPWDTV